MIEINQQQLFLCSGELNQVLTILKQFVPEKDVWAFGSRVTGNAKEYSDLDLAVISTEPMTFSQMADLKDAFSESTLVFKVDIVDWAVTSDAFRKIIEEKKVVLQSVV